MAFAGATRADRDLRDAFRAIKLMRADLDKTRMDLDKTRAEKRQLEVAAALWSQREAAAREAASMREEDFQAQLGRVASAYEAQLAASFVLSQEESRLAASASSKRGVKSSGGSTAQPESGSDEEVATVRAPSPAKGAEASGNQFYNDGDRLVVKVDRKYNIGGEHVESDGDNNCCDHEDEEDMTKLATDEAVQETLRLQSDNRRLCIALEDMRSEMVQTRVEFEETKTDLELSLEESEQQSADKSARIEELVREKQFAEEKYAFLHTELDLLRQGQRELTAKLREAEDAKLELQQTIDDVKATHQLEAISAQNTYQTERAELVGEVKALNEQLASFKSTSDAGLVEQIQHELAGMGEQLERRDAEITKLQEELARVQGALHSTQESHGSTITDLQTKLESFSQTSMILKGQLVEKEEELARSRVDLREQEEALRASRAECVQLRDELRSACDERDACKAALEHEVSTAAAAYASLERAVQKEESRISELRDEKRELEAELDSLRPTNKKLAQELEYTKQELHLAQQDASAQRDELLQSRSRCDELEQDLRAASAQLERVTDEQKQAARVDADVKWQLELQLQDAHAANVALSGQLSEAQSQAAVQEQNYNSLSMEKKALQQELQQTVISREPEFVKHARRFHRRVFEVLAHWYEVTDHDEVPAPPVAIASREVALILANWTRDKAKRVSTRQWLEQVEAIGGASLSSGALSPGLGVDGTMLVLDDMTSEVKQAFLVLVVPILRRNPAVFVRVFTRLVSLSRGSTRTTIAMLEDKRWEMKIHVQPSMHAASSSMHVGVLPLADDYGLDRLPRSPSSVSSTSTNSSATSFASARLQIIQERLQRMQSR